MTPEFPKRRFSFASINKIKEFQAAAESVTLKNTPVYDEHFSATSPDSCQSSMMNITCVSNKNYSESYNISLRTSRSDSNMNLTSIVNRTNECKIVDVDDSNMETTDVVSNDVLPESVLSQPPYDEDIKNLCEKANVHYDNHFASSSVPSSRKSIFEPGFAPAKSSFPNPKRRHDTTFLTNHEYVSMEMSALLIDDEDKVQTKPFDEANTRKSVDQSKMILNKNPHDSSNLIHQNKQPVIDSKTLKTKNDCSFKTILLNKGSLPRKCGKVHPSSEVKLNENNSSVQPTLSKESKLEPSSVDQAVGLGAKQNDAAEDVKCEINVTPRDTAEKSLSEGNSTGSDTNSPLTVGINFSIFQKDKETGVEFCSTIDAKKKQRSKSISNVHVNILNNNKKTKEKDRVVRELRFCMPATKTVSSQNFQPCVYASFRDYSEEKDVEKLQLKFKSVSLIESGKASDLTQTELKRDGYVSRRTEKSSKKRPSSKMIDHDEIASNIKRPSLWKLKTPEEAHNDILKKPSSDEIQPISENPIIGQTCTKSYSFEDNVQQIRHTRESCVLEDSSVVTTENLYVETCSKLQNLFCTSKLASDENQASNDGFKKSVIFETNVNQVSSPIPAATESDLQMKKLSTQLVEDERIVSPAVYSTPYSRKSVKSLLNLSTLEAQFDDVSPANKTSLIVNVGDSSLYTSLDLGTENSMTTESYVVSSEIANETKTLIESISSRQTHKHNGQEERKRALQNIRQRLKRDFKEWRVKTVGDDRWTFQFTKFRSFAPEYLELIVDLPVSTNYCSTRFHLVENRLEEHGEVKKIAFEALVRKCDSKLQKLRWTARQIPLMFEMITPDATWAVGFVNDMIRLHTLEGVKVKQNVASFTVASYRNFFMFTVEIRLGIQNWRLPTISDIVVTEEIGRIDKRKIWKLFSELEPNCNFFSVFIKQVYNTFDT